jgi:hypothetical protein
MKPPSPLGDDYLAGLRNSRDFAQAGGKCWRGAKDRIPFADAVAGEEIIDGGARLAGDDDAGGDRIAKGEICAAGPVTEVMRPSKNPPRKRRPPGPHVGRTVGQFSALATPQS